MCCALFVAMSVGGVGLWVRFVIPAAGRTGYHFDHFRFAVSFRFSFFNPRHRDDRRTSADGC